MRKFLTIALPMSLAVWFSAAALGASLVSPDQTVPYTNEGSELQPTTNTCTWIYWRGSWWCI